MQDNLTTLANQVVKHLSKSKQTLALAESCTGGWIAKLITDIAGSSSVFECGLVAYSNTAKRELLGVKAATLESFGAVSEETVIEMATGALKKSHATYAIAVSGIAGPGGGSVDKPVGTVWICWVKTKNIQVKTKKFQFDGDRNQIRIQACSAALDTLLKEPLIKSN